MILLISLVIGLAVGYSNIIKDNLRQLLIKLFNFVFLAMLTLLGYNLAINNEVTENIGSIGFLSLLFSFFICFSSVVITALLIRLIQPIQSIKEDKTLRANAEFNLKEAFIPVLAILLGSIIGLVNPSLIVDHERWIYWLMLFMIFEMGIEIGKTREGLKIIKHIGWFGLIVPAGALTGSIVGSLVFGIVAGIPPLVSVAIGSGSGFYTVTAPVVANAVGAQYGALALLTNFLRETLTITLLPVLAVHFKHPALITMGGATTMDTTLPVITRSLGPKAAMIGLVQGIVLSLLVPVLLPIILGM